MISELYVFCFIVKGHVFYMQNGFRENLAYYSNWHLIRDRAGKVKIEKALPVIIVPEQSHIFVCDFPLTLQI